MDVRKLRVLCELDARGTIAEVASALYMTPSAVSQQIAALGRQVGVQLIEPDGRRVRLTAAGLVLVRHAYEILAQVERAWAGLSDLSLGNQQQVRIAGDGGVLGALGLAAVLQLREIRPRLSILLHAIEPLESIAMLQRGEVDIVIGAEADFESVIDDSRFMATTVVMDHYELVLPTCHRLARAELIRLADLSTDSWVFADSNACRDVGLSVCRAAGFIPSATHVMGDWPTVLEAVRLGLGVALAPSLMLADQPEGVVSRTPAGESLRHHFIAVVRKGSEEAAHIAVVLDALDDVIAQQSSTGAA